MPIFKYTALAEDGTTRTGIQEGGNARDVQARLRAENLYVTAINPIVDHAESKKHRLRFLASLPSRGRLREVSLITRQLATLLAAGVPMVESLDILIEQAEKVRTRTVLMDVRERVTQGMPLAAAMGNHPRYFDNLYVAMIEAGEASGELDQILKRTAAYLEDRGRTQQKVITALTYPAIMSTVGVGVVMFLMIYVVPKITGIITSQGRELPLPTMILTAASKAFQALWWVVVMAVVLTMLAARIYRATDRGRFVTDSLLLRLPLFGNLFRKQSIGRFAVTFSTLLKSGIPVLDCLEILKEVVNNSVLARTLEEVRTKITTGTDISTPIKKSGMFPPMVGYMVAIGEESGQLESILDQIAESYEQEIDAATERLTSMIEPILILILAAIVGFIVLSVLLPILKISEIS